MAQLKDLIVNGPSHLIGSTTVANDPVAAMEVATKQYVDNQISTTVPSGSKLTDENVKQNAVITTNSNYPILLGYSNTTNEVIDSVNKTDALRYNPSTQLLTAPKISSNIQPGSSIGGVYYKYDNFSNWGASGGKTGWVKLYSVPLDNNNRLNNKIVDFVIWRSYNSPAPESYYIRAVSQYQSIQLMQMGGNYKNTNEQLITKFRVVADTTNHILYFEIYIENKGSSNTGYIRTIFYGENSTFTKLNEVQTEEDSAFSVWATLENLGKTPFIGNLTGNVTGVADKATAANLTTTQNAIAKYSDTTGSFANSGVTIDSNNNITTAGNIIASELKGYVTVGQLNGSTLGQKVTAEGNCTTASGDYSHAEGDSAYASGEASHSEGYDTAAEGSYSHAEGDGTRASAAGAHAEGGSTVASGTCAHAEGRETTASGEASHSEGYDTIAARRSQHTFGEYNIEDTQGSDENSKGQYIEIVGNGTSSTARSNARTLDWSGNEELAGKLTVGAVPTADMDVATKQYVDNKIFYGTTSTAAATAAKVVTCSDYVLNKGNIISVRFGSYANTATTMSLNVNSTGAKNVYYNNSTAIPNDLIQLYDTVTFIYDGSYYRLITIDRQDAKAYYGTTATAAATAAKVVTCANYILRKGNIISVRFGSYANTALTMSLNVNSTGAKNVYYNNSTTIPSDLIQLNDTVTFVYDGSYYRLISVDPINTSNIIYSVTAAGTAAKIGIAKAFTLQPGFFQVLMLNSNTYNGAITLNIKSTGAKPIYINRAASSSTNKTLPAGYYLVYYDGSKYYFNTENNFYVNEIYTSDIIFHKGTDSGVASVYKGLSNNLMIRNTFDTDGSIDIISDYSNIDLVAHTKNSFKTSGGNNGTVSEIAFIDNGGLQINEGKDIYFKSASGDTYDADAGGIHWYKSNGTTRKATLRVPNINDTGHSYPAPIYDNTYNSSTGQRHLGLTNAFFAKAGGTSQTRNNVAGYDISLYNNIRGSAFCNDHPVQPGDIISVYFPTATTTSILALHVGSRPFGSTSSQETTTYQSLKMYKGAMSAIGAITAGKTITFIAMWAIKGTDGGIGSQTPALCLYKIAEC